MYHIWAMVPVMKQRQRPVTYGQPEQKRSTSLASTNRAKESVGLSKKDGKDQEPIQSSITSGPG